MHAFPYQNIVLGVSGGVAAYKSAELIRLLRQQGASVRVVMTQGATAFITPMTLQALSGHPVHSDLFDPAAEAAMGHIELAKWADLVLIAPATAHCMAKLVHGLADDLLTTLCLATEAPLVLAPAMNQAMWRSPQTQANVQRCSKLNIQLLGPADGEQACGDIGPGRMLEPLDIMAALGEKPAFAVDNTALANKRVLITAGPTREALDPVRFLSNPSSGKMGFALATAAAAYGARVTLVAGPVQQPTPPGVERIDVVSACDMHRAVTMHDCDLFIACAAVADYRPAEMHAQKIKKSDADLQLQLVRNPDILADVSLRQPRPFCVGFAAETETLKKNARAKLEAKRLDMIIANNVSNPDTGFAYDTNQVRIFWQQDGKTKQQKLALMAKQKLAFEIMSMINQCYAQAHTSA